MSGDVLPSEPTVEAPFSLGPGCPWGGWVGMVLALTPDRQIAGEDLVVARDQSG